MIRDTILSPKKEAPRHKKTEFGINIGSASILLIFVILCLVSFATLSIVSANADHKLSTRILDRMTIYYEACAQAENALADLDEKLQDAYVKAADGQAFADEQTYYALVGRSASYTYPLSDTQTLQVEVAIQYPTAPKDTFYRITRWQVTTDNGTRITDPFEDDLPF